MNLIKVSERSGIVSTSISEDVWFTVNEIIFINFIVSEQNGPVVNDCFFFYVLLEKS